MFEAALWNTSTSETVTRALKPRRRVSQQMEQRYWTMSTVHIVFHQKTYDEQRVTEVSSAAARQGDTPPKRRLKWRPQLKFKDVYTNRTCTCRRNEQNKMQTNRTLDEQNPRRKRADTKKVVPCPRLNILIKDYIYSSMLFLSTILK